MGNRSDIWHFLREHETPPPPELLRHIGDALNGVDKKNDLPSFTTDKGRLKGLQQVETIPPVFVRALIDERIKQLGPVRTGPVRRLSRKRLIYAGIAASFMLLIGFTAYQVLAPGKSSHRDNPVVKNSTGPGTRQLTGNQKTSDSGETAIPPIANVTPDIATDSTKSRTIAITGRSHAAVSFGGHSIQLVDYDPLFTFTSFRYPEIGSYLDAKKEEEIKIEVDRYTNIVISRQAAAIIRDLYQTRTNGKPARRARKAKQKLEDWKRADEKNFDGLQPANPTDPLDLGGFIFK